MHFEIEYEDIEYDTRCVICGRDISDHDENEREDCAEAFSTAQEEEEMRVNPY